MKYEARLPNGDLIGTVELPDNGHRYVSMHIITNFSLSDFIGSNKSHLPIKTVEFEVGELTWYFRGTKKVVPTAILIKGKKTWLRGQSWFRGLR